MSKLDDIIGGLESSWAHEQLGSLWARWVPGNPQNAAKLKAYWDGPLDATPPVITSEYGQARLDQMVAHHALKRGVQLSEIILIGTPTLTYDRLTGWPRPAFTPSRTVNFTTVNGLNTAISGMAAGDLIQYTGTGVLNNTTSGGSIDFLQSKNPASTVVIDLGTVASGNYVKFSFTGTGLFTAAYCYDCSNITVYGGEFVTSSVGGSGIIWFGPMSNITWWDFVIHGAGGDGIDLFTKDHSTSTARSITNCSFRGEVYNWGLNLANDPHFLGGGEQGTGWHAAQVCDTNPAGNFTGNTVALYGHDAANGAVLQFGQPVGGADLSGNFFYLKGENLTKVATSQVAANVWQLWGPSDFGNSQLVWGEGTNLQGRIVDMQGIGSGSRVGLTDQIVVKHGRHSNTNQNPLLGSTESGVSASQPYDDRGAITYQDCR